MRTTTILITGLIIALSAVANANPKCSHRSGDGLFANTNPVKSSSSTTKTTGSATVKGIK